MKCLLVIDMQEEYVGSFRNAKLYPYQADELINSINHKIAEYPKDSVVYIVNRFSWEIGRKPKKLVEGLSVVSDNLFEKRKASCFSNSQFLEYLKKKKVSELELVGVDGNYCVGASALGGIKYQYKIFLNEPLVGIGNPQKFNKTKNLLKQKGVIIT